MTTNVQPAASLAPLVHPHGSATYTDQTSAWRARVLAAVNGPLDFHGRRDIRRADTAAADVLVKPGVGHALSGVKCRHLEAVVRGVIGEGLVRGFGMGRMGVVITLVVTAGETPERRGSAGRGGRVRVGSVSMRFCIPFPLTLRYTMPRHVVFSLDPQSLTFFFSLASRHSLCP